MNSQGVPSARDQGNEEVWDKSPQKNIESILQWNFPGKAYITWRTKRHTYSSYWVVDKVENKTSLSENKDARIHVSEAKEITFSDNH